MLLSINPADRRAALVPDPIGGPFASLFLDERKADSRALREHFCNECASVRRARKML